MGRLVAGGVRNTKDRDALALEVRAGTPVWGAHPGTLRVEQHQQKQS